jgi:type I restriction enzyme M protein
MLSSETKRRIDSCRDILVGQLPLPTDQVELITLALIYKFMDDLDEQSVQLGGKRSFFIKELADFRWRSLMPQTVSAADRVRLFADGLEALGDPKTGKHLPEMFRDIFRNAMLKFRDGRILSLFLTELDGFAYSHSEELGNAFEYLLQSMGAQGDNGQFRTPRHIIDFIVEVLEPKPEDKILDPACGTGGFLVSAYKHILGKHTSKGSSVPGDQLSPAKKEKLTQQLNGYDITPMMVKLSKVNMFLHGFSDPQIHEYDTLSNDARWNEKYDLIMANPPFMTPKGGVVPHTKFRIAAKKAEVLFTDYIAEHLTTNGRAGIIVPEGIIFQSANAYRALRKFLVEDSLVSVISLPAGVFNPYSGVKTSILILDKGLARQSDSIAFFKVDNDGYDLGAQRRTIDKNDLPRLSKEIREYLEKLRSGKKISDKDELHIVSKEKIAANGEFNLGAERHRDEKICKGKWNYVELGEVSVVDWGNTELTKSSYAENGPYLAVSATGCDGRISHFEHEPYVTVISAIGALCGKLFLPTERFTAIKNTMTVTAKTETLNPKYLFAVLASNKLPKRGAAQPFIAKGDVLTYKIPLPPLLTQKEIVAEIEGYQKVIDGARAVVENYKPHITIDPKWPVVVLGDVLKLSSGRGLTKTDMKEGGYPVYGGNGKTGTHSEFFQKEPNIVIGRVGAYCGSVHITEPNAWITDNALYVTEFKQEIDLRFLAQSLIQLNINQFAKVGGQPSISQTTVSERSISIPPPSAQKAIVAQLEEEQTMVNANKELIARFENKIQAVMDRAWGGGIAD